MTDYRDGNTSNRYDPDPLKTDASGNMLDFDYSSVLDRDYSKDLEQKIFVDGTGSDLLGEMSGTDRKDSSLYTGSFGNITDYLNEKNYEIPDTSVQDNPPFLQESLYSQKAEPADSDVGAYQYDAAQRADQGAVKETLHKDAAQSAPKASDHPSVLETYYKQKTSKASDQQSTPHPAPAYTQTTPKPAHAYTQTTPHPASAYSQTTPKPAHAYTQTTSKPAHTQPAPQPVQQNRSLRMTVLSIRVKPAA